jgi:hypothetical protein
VGSNPTFGTVSRRAAVTLALGAFAVSACGGGERAAPPRGSIDIRAGSYRGVGLGDHVEAMHRTFGPQPPAAAGEPIVARFGGDPIENVTLAVLPFNGV